jgi:hypothetical protein
VFVLGEVGDPAVAPEHDVMGLQLVGPGAAREAAVLAIEASQERPLGGRHDAGSAAFVVAGQVGGGDGPDARQGLTSRERAQDLGERARGK